MLTDSVGPPPFLLGRARAASSTRSSRTAASTTAGRLGIDHFARPAVRVHRSLPASVLPWRELTSPRPTPTLACQRILTAVFNVLFFGVLALIATSFIRACLADRRPPASDPAPPPYSPGPGPGGPGGGPGPSKTRPAPPQAQPPAQGWRPGFWTGLGLAGAAGWLWDLTRPRGRDQPTGGQHQRYRTPGYGGIDDPCHDPYHDHRDRDWRDQPGPSRHHGHHGHDRTGGGGGGGSSGSGLGEIRTSTGFGGSSVR
jgi:hypothetical protein